MTRILPMVGWVLVAIDFIVAATLLLGRKGGDAATRAIGPGLGALLIFMGIVAAALVFWGSRGEGRSILLFAGSGIAALPIVVAIALTASPRAVLGLIYPSMREPKGEMEEAPQYAFPDKVTREAAIAIVMNDYAKLDSLLHAKPAADLTAHDELGHSLLGLATQAAVMDGGTMRDLDGLKLILAAGGKPRADDLGRDDHMMELITRVSGERSPIVLGMLIDAGLSPETPTRDGGSALFYKYLSPEAAKILLARGANANARLASADSANWSPVTFHVWEGNWATALALLEGGVPRDHASPVGSTLAKYLPKDDGVSINLHRDDPAHQAFMAKLK